VSALRGFLANPIVSRYYDTVPVGSSGPQAIYLNAVVVGDSALTARALLDALLAIEQERGRERP
jgi:2-amino-4-hydroxy-6-hydroxymethyldihydropteridine diphosphokinase